MLRALKNKVERVVPLIGIDDITGSNGLGIKTPSAVKKVGEVHVDLARASLSGDYKKLVEKYGPQPPDFPNIPGPAGATPVDAKSFGNTSYSENSLYKEGMVPGSIDAQAYKK